MIVKNRQGIEPRAQRLAQGDMAFEIHLPQIVGSLVLEADEALRSAAELPKRLAVPCQDRGHRRSRWSRQPRAQQPMPDLASAPGRMIPAHGKHCGFHRFATAQRRLQGPSRAFDQTS